MAKSILSAPHFQDETAAFAYVEARLWPQGPVCPHCGTMGDKVGRLNGKTTRPGLCKCYECQKPFTVRMGTIFESSHLALRLWLQVIHLMCASKKGIATRQIQRMLQCSMKTAWFTGHRIREAMAIGGGLPPMGGAGSVIEADETFVGRKPGTKVRAGHGHMNAVFSLVERGGKVRSFHVPDVNSGTLVPMMKKNISSRSTVMTDSSWAYGSLPLHFVRHAAVNHSKDEYVRGDAYTNTIEGFFSVFKRGVYGTYQHISEAHLKRYLAEFDFRYSNREKLGIGDTQRADLALLGVKGKRLTYRTTSGKRGTEARAS
jgi:transposase-like protein